MLRDLTSSGSAPTSALSDAGELARTLAGDALGRSGEPVVAHGEGTLAILQALRVDEPTQVAALLFGLGEWLPLDAVRDRFGPEVHGVVEAMRNLLRLKEVRLQANARSSTDELETLRRMTLAMAADIRVVLLRLASRLQTLRYHAAVKRPAPEAIAGETLAVLAPLANRLGLAQLKWEMEDLAFRFLEPDAYRSLAGLLEERRSEREGFVERAASTLRGLLAAQGIAGEVSGRPKHLYSIRNKMRAKGLALDDLQDLRALRVLVDDVRACYAVLGLVHQTWPPVPREFDDYISRPKPNGYRSLHTVVIAEDGRPLEIQIRTREMHRDAELGVAAHWRYKEASAGAATGRGSRDGAGAPDDGEVRIGWLRQLLMWQQELGATLGGRVPTAGDGARIYVLTPQARVVELPAGATAVDFAYHVHTDLGHRCRGARVDGHMVALNTPLRTGQTVEIVTVRAGAADGPSRDWLNASLGYVHSARARAKVRQWFHAADLARDVAAGRARVERVLQREGRTALGFDELARRAGFERADDLFVAVARDELGPRALADAVRPPAADAVPHGAQASTPPADASVPVPAPRVARGGTTTGRAGSVSPVSVVGVDFLLTQLARCCRPAPPDPIVGFVTRGQGVSVHRAGCRTFAAMAQRAPERVLETEWGAAARRGVGAGAEARYAVEVALRASDRPGLLRDVTEVFARDRLNIVAMRTLTRDGVAQLQITVEVPGVPQLERTLVALRGLGSVLEAHRR